MSISKQEDKLFATWCQKDGYCDAFVKDGVPCPEKFENTKTKITFVLKEPNNYLEPDMDMRAWVHEYGGCSKTWDNITRWTKAVLDDCKYPQLVSSEDRLTWLNKISFLNLKKTNGGASSVVKQIWEFSEQDSDFIYQQLSIYKPDVIVCCGIDLVADCLADYVFKREGKWEHSKENPRFCWFYVQLPGKKEKTVILNFYQPLNLGTKMTNEALFYQFKKAYQEIMLDR